MALPTPWPHQTAAVRLLHEATARGARRILLVCPTGGGKTRITIDLTTDYAERGDGVLFLTNRKLLVEQLTTTLSAHGVMHGVRAAGYRDEREYTVQISSIQTELARVFRRQDWRRWQLHPAKLVIVDEAHLNAGKEAKKLLGKLHEAGAAIVGVTATPLGLAHLYDELIQVAVQSELRACGALVAARHFGIEEPDLRDLIGQVKIGDDFSEQQIVQAIMVPGIVGRVVDWFKKLNPQMLPTLGFGPGVGESLYFAQEFEKAGIPAAHIDGEDVWFRGERLPSSRSSREKVLAASKTGEVVAVWNRFVLREGVDMPWLRHGIVATVLGSFSTYLQSLGRLLRAYPGKDDVTIQDHGGNWLRHGSVNADYRFKLTSTNRLAALVRADGLRENVCQQCGEDPPEGAGKRWTCGTCGFANGPEPLICPRCRKVLMKKVCDCGYVILRRARFVYQHDGTLVEHVGPYFVPRKTNLQPNTQQLWNKVYYQFRNAKKPLTWLQAEAYFFRKFFYWPPRTMKLMPKGADWYLPVKDVPSERLR